MRALKFAGAAIGAVIVIIALLLVIGIPSGFMTSQIQERVERETGYKLTINGGTRIGFWPSLNIVLNDVTLQDPKNGDVNNRITVSSIQADVTLASVWSGKPQVTELTLVRPVVNLPLQRERLKDAPAASKPAAGAGDGLDDRACQRHRRHDRVFQSARPRREQDRDHQRRNDASIPIARSGRPATRAPASMR